MNDTLINFIYTFIYADVKVILQCKASEFGQVTYTKTGITDEHGIYTIPMEGDHKSDYCEVLTDQTTHPSCTETIAAKGDRVMISAYTDLSSLSTHFVRPLGFMSKEFDRRCIDLVKEYDILTIQRDG